MGLQVRLLLSGADVTRGTLPTLAPAFAVGKPLLVVVAVQGAPWVKVSNTHRIHRPRAE